MKKNKKNYTAHLNALYTDIYSEEQAVDAFIYLTVRGRMGGHISERKIRNAHQRRELGNLSGNMIPLPLTPA
jgi:hypothetical protein